MVPLIFHLYSPSFQLNIYGESMAITMVFKNISKITSEIYGNFGISNIS
jgi:hypothetical protein